jgi:hypothetical protein
LTAVSRKEFGMITISAYVLEECSYDSAVHLLDFDVTNMELCQLEDWQASELAHRYLLLEDPDTDITPEMIVVSIKEGW